MCGIGGVFNIQQTEQNKIVHVFKDCLKERGPDANDYWAEDRQLLFHGRLSILDLSDAGRQPMTTKRTVLSFNGEIYNFKPLRTELEQQGYLFKTGTDSEMLLYGYEHWGIDVLLSKIEGMFAMAIYDKQEQKAYLIRDHFGKKPLYYYKSKTAEIVFSSDIRAIHRLYKEELTINQEALDYYFVEISTPQPHTIWQNVQQVEPAHYLTIDLRKERLEEKEYWSIQQSYFGQPFKGDMQEALDETERLLTAAILKRTMADVPLGCFLSGGVDSGLIVSMLASNTSEQVNTYTIGFDYDEFNELDDARLVAERYNTNHHEIRLKPDVIEILPDLIEYYGEPFADSSMIPTYYVCKAIRKDVVVALSGDGGDEGFGGYANYGVANKWTDYFELSNNKVLREAYVPVSKVLSRFSGRFKNYGDFSPEKNGYAANLLSRRMLFSMEELAKLGRTNGAFVTQYLERQLAPFQKANHVDKIMLASLKTRLLNDYLVKVDRASMKNSIEVRAPFLDKSLMEFAMKIPRELKFFDQQKKYLLKKLGEKYMYKDIFTRKKRGFGIPVNIWLKKELKSFTEERILDQSFLRKFNLNGDYIQDIFQAHISDKADYRHRIWSLLCLSIWSEKFNA